MRKEIDPQELSERTELNFSRLANSSYYQIGEVFSPDGYQWYGDKEGRALLAFVCHYEINGRVIPCMEEMLALLPEKLNDKGFFGPLCDPEAIHEQQLSGHSWLLRGLCAHYDAFGDRFSLECVKKIIKGLYLPLKGKFYAYPLERGEKNKGGVSGSCIGNSGGWILSSDTGCAFMSIDGLSHAFRITGDGAIKELLDEMISVYLAIDKAALKAQTHCTLTAARGMLAVYLATGDEKYLLGAKSIFALYAEGGGMSATYQNLNWWGRPDSWTEPCAIVDSLILGGELYKITGEAYYRTLAARIFHNGLATAQRSNGGAGTDTLAVKGHGDTLSVAKHYEAYFCCTMRLAEGLLYATRNRELLYAELDGRVEKNERVYSDGDIIYAEANEELRQYAERIETVDGRTLCPIIKYYKVPEDIARAGKQRIIFD